MLTRKKNRRHEWNFTIWISQVIRLSCSRNTEYNETIKSKSCDFASNFLERSGEIFIKIISDEQIKANALTRSYEVARQSDQNFLFHSTSPMRISLNGFQGILPIIERYDDDDNPFFKDDPAVSSDEFHLRNRIYFLRRTSRSWHTLFNPSIDRPTYAA